MHRKEAENHYIFTTEWTLWQFMEPLRFNFSWECISDYCRVKESKHQVILDVGENLRVQLLCGQTFKQIPVSWMGLPLPHLKLFSVQPHRSLQSQLFHFLWCSTGPETWIFPFCSVTFPPCLLMKKNQKPKNKPLIPYSNSCFSDSLSCSDSFKWTCSCTFSLPFASFCVSLKQKLNCSFQKPD